MNPLNEDELDSLLKQAEWEAPDPGPDLAARTMRAYRAKRMRPRRWALRPVSIAWPVAILAAALLLAIGAAAGRSFAPRGVEVRLGNPRIISHDVFRDCAATQQEAKISSLTLLDFQPVRQIRPRVVRSISIGAFQNDQ